MVTSHVNEAVSKIRRGSFIRDFHVLRRTRSYKRYSSRLKYDASYFLPYKWPYYVFLIASYYSTHYVFLITANYMRALYFIFIHTEIFALNFAV